MSRPIAAVHETELIYTHSDVITATESSRPGIWHRRLRHLSPDTAAALREIFRERETVRLAGNPGTTWSFGPARAVSSSTTIVLQGSHEQFLLSLAEDGLCERLGPREWWDYEGESRLLAWTLAHSLLIEDLGRLLREPLLPTAGGDTIPCPPDPLGTATLSFIARTSDGRQSVGLLNLSAAMLSRLASSSCWQPSPPAYEPWTRLPTGLRIELRRIHFPLSDLIPARTGDVLVLGRRVRCWHNLEVTVNTTANAGLTSRAWYASYEGQQLRLGEVTPAFPTEEIMFEPASDTSETTPTASVMASVPITLDFEVGNLSLPLGELAALKPGYVFQLPTRLEDARVVIRANGTRIGHGELVAVGDVLGVQLLSIETNGLR